MKGGRGVLVPSGCVQCGSCFGVGALCVAAGSSWWAQVAHGSAATLSRPNKRLRLRGDLAAGSFCSRRWRARHHSSQASVITHSYTVLHDDYARQ